MTAAPALPPSEQISGLVERVTFHNADSGFCGLRMKVRGERELVTLVGHAPSVTPGEYAAAAGNWVTDRERGRQFRAVFVKIAPPNTLSGIERYLGSGMVKGIGPVYASRLVGAFGTAVLDVIEQTPERLREISGIGAKRASKIASGWADQKLIREIMVLLYAHGVSTSRAVWIFKTYDNQAIAVVQENPYRLARDIRGIGFCPPTRSPRRSASRWTHPCARRPACRTSGRGIRPGTLRAAPRELLTLAVEHLKIPGEIIERAIAQEVADEVLVCPDVRGVRSGKLECREGSAWGNPYWRQRGSHRSRSFARAKEDRL